MPQKKKRLVTISTITFIFFVVGLFLFNAFYGNPISKNLAIQAANKYIKNNYETKQLEIEYLGYNPKFANYNFYAKSNVSSDTYFSIAVDRKGNIKWDTYNDVTSGRNTMIRLQKEYKHIVQKSITGQFPYHIQALKVKFIPSTTYDEPTPIADTKLDIHHLPRKTEIIIEIQNHAVDWDTVAKLTKQLDQIMQKQKLSIERYTISLTNENHTKQLDVKNFPQSLLNSDNLAEAMKTYK